MGTQPRSLPPGQPDPGHLLPEKEWERVQREAEREAERIARRQAPLEAPPVGRRTTGALAVTAAVSAPSNGGRRALGAPQFGVLHSAETPLRAGYAAAIAKYFAGGPGTSCHYMTDPAETWGVLDDALVAWHCGNGNPNSVALEQAGYARFSRAEWTTPDGLRQMERNAAVMRACRGRYGIGLYWMTDAQLLAAHRGAVGGWATHDQCRRVLGGTVHTDPMPNYPLADLMALAIGAPPAPAPAPAAPLEDDDMRLNAYRVTGTSAVFAGGPGTWLWVDDNTTLRALQRTGTLGPIVDCSQAELDDVRRFWLAAVVNSPITDDRGAWTLGQRLASVDAVTQALVLRGAP